MKHISTATLIVLILISACASPQAESPAATTSSIPEPTLSSNATPEVPGDRFKSVLACLDEALKCDLTFPLEYFDAYGNLHAVSDAKWVITYDPAGDYTYADVNLDFLAGQQVQFLLAVRDNGDPSEDFGVWIAPHI